MGGPPDNGMYMRAAYVIVCFFYFGYSLLLWRRNASLRERARKLGMTVK